MDPVKLYKVLTKINNYKNNMPPSQKLMKHFPKLIVFFNTKQILADMKKLK